MKQEQSNTKKYLLTVEIDIEALVAAYKGGDNSIQLYDLPPIEEIIEFECGWISSSGIRVKKVEEMKE